MHRIDEKGINVTDTERSIKTLSCRTGFFAMLRALDGSGCGARLCSILALVTAVILVVAVSASAATHVLSTSFGTPGSGAGQVALASPVINGEKNVTAGGSGVAFSNETHDVYVADTGNHRIDEFEASGTFIRAWGWGVADGITKAFQTCTLTCFAGISGSGPGQFESPTFVAVDNSTDASAGDVYVADTGDNLVSKFDSSGNLIASWGNNGPSESPNGQLKGSPTQPFDSLAGIAVGPSGVLYALNASGPSEMFTFDQSGSFASEFVIQYASAPVGFAVDATGDFYRAVESGAAGGLLQYGPSGTFIGEVSHVNSFPTGFAVDPVNNDLYIDERGTSIEYNPLANCHGQGECIPTDSFGSGQIEGGAGLTVDPSNETVYAADTAAGRIDVFSLLGPYAVTDPASSMTGTSATLNGHLAPTSGGPITDCHFEYVDAADYEKALEESAPNPYSAGQSIPCSPATPLSNPTTVSAVVTGLQFATAYHFRISATDSKATNPGSDRTFRTHGAEIISGSASDITATAATLNAQVNPLGEPTTYHFEYLTEAAYLENGGSFSGPQQATIIPQPDGVVGSGVEAVEVSQHPQGLQLHTTYRYRVVAFDSVAPEGIVGPVLAFTTQGSGSPLVLSDGREWEMVSPSDKFGAEVLGVSGSVGAMEASVAGGAITYLATAPTEGESAGNADLTQVLSLRGSGGWGSRDIAIPHSEAVALTNIYSEYPYFSEDLSLAVVQPFRAFDPSLSGEASEQTAYLRTGYLHGNVNDRCVESCYRPLVTGAPGFENVPSGTEFGVCEGAQLCQNVKVNQCPPAFHCGPQFEAASPDLGHVVIRSQVALTQGAPSGTDSVSNSDLYEWSGGQLTFVGQGAVGVPDEEAESSAARHAVSDDGSRIVILGESEGLRGLLIRDTAKGKTVKLDAVQGGSGAGTAEPVFQTASSDGSKVFFIDTQRLTKDAGATSGVPDLYECEIVEAGGKLACDLTDLTPEHSGESGSVDAPILGVSTDGSSVYFVAGGVLTGAEENEHGEKAQGGQPNLYLSHDGVTKLIAVLSPKDAPDWGNKTFVPVNSMRDMTGRVSSDGRWLAFMSQRSLTGYVNRDASSGNPDEEVYLYHAAVGVGAGTLVCASCNPTGARPHGVEYAHLTGGPAVGYSPTWRPEQWLAANVPGWTSALYQSRYLSDNGRLFFNSSDALVPQDTNGTEDVYEYEPPGVGDCSESSPTFSRVSGGCVGLISSGTSPEESGFMDASESGGDVFFLTAAELSSRDTDTALDVYDAHQCSVSVPCFPAPPAPLPACEGDACQSSVAAPEDPTPGSLTFSGPGNPVLPASPLVVKSKPKSKPAKCRKGFVKKKGKCVKSRAKRATRSAKGRK